MTEGIIDIPMDNIDANQTGNDHHNNYIDGDNSNQTAARTQLLSEKGNGLRKKKIKNNKYIDKILDKYDIDIQGAIK